MLAGKLFDDRGNRMSPSHATKRGRRYRYYVSRAILQGQKEDVGSVARVPALELERRVVDAVEARLPRILAAARWKRKTRIAYLVERLPASIVQ
jgi:site-specific DNA recombinase